MKVWLDDERPAPPGWRHETSPSVVIDLISLGFVSEVSLDHDLGEEVIGTGYDVLRWLESRVYAAMNYGVPLDFELPRISIHTANPAARSRMAQAVASIAKGSIQLSNGDA